MSEEDKVPADSQEPVEPAEEVVAESPAPEAAEAAVVEPEMAPEPVGRAGRLRGARDCTRTCRRAGACGTRGARCGASARCGRTRGASATAAAQPHLQPPWPRQRQ